MRIFVTGEHDAARWLNRLAASGHEIVLDPEYAEALVVVLEGGYVPKGSRAEEVMRSALLAEAPVWAPVGLVSSVLPTGPVQRMCPVEECSDCLRTKCTRCEENQYV